MLSIKNSHYAVWNAWFITSVQTNIVHVSSNVSLFVRLNSPCTSSCNSTSSDHNLVNPCLLWIIRLTFIPTHMSLKKRCYFAGKLWSRLCGSLNLKSVYCAIAYAWRHALVLAEHVNRLLNLITNKILLWLTILITLTLKMSICPLEADILREKLGQYCGFRFPGVTCIHKINTFCIVYGR